MILCLENIYTDLRVLLPCALVGELMLQLAAAAAQPEQQQEELATARRERRKRSRHGSNGKLPLAHLGCQPWLSLSRVKGVKGV